MSERRRRAIPPKTRLRIFKRDNYRCTICGASPATNSPYDLEVDHHVPFSHGGSDGDSNLRTLCRSCNRGKGNDETLNKTLDRDLLNLLDQINPEITATMATQGSAVVVANAEDFADLVKRNKAVDGYDITVLPNTLMGYHAGFNMGIYTRDDNGSAKTNFRIAPRA